MNETISDELLKTCLGIAVLVFGLLFSSMAVFGETMKESAAGRRVLSGMGVLSVFILILSLVAGAWHEVVEERVIRARNEKIANQLDNLEKALLAVAAGRAEAAAQPMLFSSGMVAPQVHIAETGRIAAKPSADVSADPAPAPALPAEIAAGLEEIRTLLAK